MEKVILYCPFNFSGFWNIAIYIISLGTYWAFADFEAKNLMHIVITLCLIIHHLIFRRVVHKVKIPKMIGLLIAYMLIQTVFNQGNAKNTSIVYSLFWLVSYIYLINVINRNLEIRTILSILLLMAWLFFIAILIQKGCQLAGIGVWNQNRAIETTLLESSIRLNGLSPEPSYGSLILIALGYVYWQLSGHKIGVIWFPVICSIVVMESSIGYIGLVLLFLSGCPIRYRFIAIVIIISIGFFIGTVGNGGPIYRIYELLLGIYNGQDLETLQLIDNSAAQRYIPFINYIRATPFDDIGLYVGHGAGSSRILMLDYIIGVDTDIGFLGGFLPGYLFDFGLIGTALVFLVIKRNAITSQSSFEWWLLLLVSVNANFNTQLFWFVLTLLTVGKICLTNASDLVKKGTLMQPVTESQRCTQI